jgi:BirA family transcriptional regulator, biotin operon repressor / biotin---[acetyl-CoA-carboxylase] ligase
LQARMMRTAISPRLAIRSLENICISLEVDPVEKEMTPTADLAADAVSRLDEPLWWALRWLEETDSTNRRLLMSPEASEGSVLVAEHQTSGRGRLDRSWDAAGGSSILCSLLVRPTKGAARHRQLLTVAVALALCEAIEQLDIDAVVKWPNDVGVSGAGGFQKLAGILAESEQDAVVVGFGCNVTADTSRPAAAVYLEKLTHQDCSRPALLAAVLNGFRSRYLQLTQDGPEALLSEFRVRCDTLGRTVRVEQTTGSWLGVATGVDDDGSLLVDNGTGIETVSVGDIVHLHVPNQVE